MTQNKGRRYPPPVTLFLRKNRSVGGTAPLLSTGEIFGKSPPKKVKRGCKEKANPCGTPGRPPKNPGQIGAAPLPRKRKRGRVILYRISEGRTAGSATDKTAKIKGGIGGFFGVIPIKG